MEKKFKELTISIILIILITTFFSKVIISERLHYDIKNFIRDSINIIYETPKLFIYDKLDPGLLKKTRYIIHFNSGVQIWKENKIFGHGLRSFRIKCSFTTTQTCNTHPHNYFIELMVETGIIGIFIIYTIIILGIINFLKYYFTEKKSEKKLLAVIFFLLIFFEFFPIRSTGSFFTTNNSAFIFLILPIFLNIKKFIKNL